MNRLYLTVVLSASVLMGPAFGQGPASKSVVSQPGGDLTPAKTTPDATGHEAEIVADPSSLLPDLPPLPPAKASLLGGTIAKLDRVQDFVSVQIFGGGKVKVYFDPRTNIFRNGGPATVADLRQGDRIYIDTVLDGGKIFARNINLKNADTVGESQGVVVSYRADKGELLVRDLLSPNPLRVRLASTTRIVRDSRVTSAAELVPGTLIAVTFGSQGKGHDLAREVSILAVPGADFTFAGQVISLDLSVGRLVLSSITDHKTYEIYLDPAAVSVGDDLRMGAAVTILTSFDGTRYVARNLTVTK